MKEGEEKLGEQENGGLREKTKRRNVTEKGGKGKDKKGKEK